MLEEGLSDPELDLEEGASLEATNQTLPELESLGRVEAKHLIDFKSVRRSEKEGDSSELTVESKNELILGQLILGSSN